MRGKRRVNSEGSKNVAIKYISKPYGRWTCSKKLTFPDKMKKKIKNVTPFGWGPNLPPNYDYGREVFINRDNFS